MHKNRRRKGQTTIEYTVLMIVVLGAFVAAGNYIKRGLQGRWKSAIDDMGDQYDPRTAVGNVRHIVMVNSLTNIIAVPTTNGFDTTRLDISNSLDRHVGSMSVGGY